VALTGFGSNIGVSQNGVYPGLKFGTQTIKTVSPTQNVTLTNKGTTPITISNITVIGEFSQNNHCNGTIAVGGKCVISVNFKPQSTDIRYGNIVITSSDIGSPHNIRAWGPASRVTLNPPSLTFPAQSVGTTSAPQTFTVGNAGTDNLTFASIVATGDYAQTNDCNVGGAGVAPGASCTVTVTFTPTAAGTRTGAISLSDNDGSLTSPQSVILTGSGT
jgi:hypothetical protein